MLTTQGLLCGCFSHTHRRALEALAAKADATLATMVSAELPSGGTEEMEREMELKETRARYGLGPEEPLPPGLYGKRLHLWLEKIEWNAAASSRHLCRHPACAGVMRSTISHDDFDREYRSQGVTTWRCPAGHLNSVLPSASEMEEVNAALLANHPGRQAQGGALAMRLCPGCAQEGILMLAEHHSGCKHWPGNASEHRHAFCFDCTRPWGGGEGHCNHGVDCSGNRPGTQQVRLVTARDGAERLEIFFVEER